MATIKERAASAAQRGSESRAWGNVLGVGLFLTVVIFIPPLGEPFTIPKIVVAMVTALSVVPLIWVRRDQLMANRWPVGLAGCFALLAVLSTLFSGGPLLGSVFGDWGRRSGTLFVIALVLMFVAGTLLTRLELKISLAWLAWAGVPATAYGLIQMVGADPFPWTDQGWVVSTFGNPNFAAAGLSMLALLTAGLAGFGPYRPVWRLLMAPLAALEGLVALSTGSSLVVFALAAGLLLGALTWVLRTSSPRRGLIAGLLAAAGCVGAALTVWGLLGSGPLAAAVSPDTLQFRRWYWGAGLQMTLGHPVFGVGPDGFGRFYGEYRSPDAAKMFSLGVNNAHDVPIQWAATLGIPATLVYIALIVAVAVVVLRRLWVVGPRTGALGIPLVATWGAYQVQSLVSIDEIAVSVLGWFAMGALLAITSTRPTPQPRPTGGVAWVAAGVLGFVGLLVWLPPMLASNASRTVVQGTTEADVLEAVELVRGGLLPCQGATPVAQWMVSVAPSDATVSSVFEFVDRDARCYAITNAAGNFAIQLQQPERAVALAQEAVEIDPLNYSPWLLLARAQALAGDKNSAQLALNEAAAIAPGNGDVAQVAADLGLTAPAPAS